MFNSVKLFIESTKPKIMVQKNIFYFLIGFFASILYYNHFNVVKLFISLIIFTIVYSSVYVVNDIFDYHRDKKHPIKRFRPIPSDRLKPQTALLIAGFIYVTGFIASIILVNPLFASCIFLMIVFNVIYSHPFFKTKKRLLNAAIILGLLQYLKLLAGWSVIAGHFKHPFMLFLIPTALYLYSTGQLLINSEHYKGRFKLKRKDFVIARSLMIIPSLLITVLLFTDLTFYIITTLIPVYFAFLFMVEKLKKRDALSYVNKYMTMLNSLLISLNALFFLVIH